MTNPIPSPWQSGFAQAMDQMANVQPVGLGQAQVNPTATQIVNPSNLADWAIGYYGAGSHVSHESAYNNWGGQKNPFIPGSPEDIAFREYKEFRESKEKTKYLKLPELVPEVRPSKRRISMPRFKPEFETLHDARLRMSGTLIFVGCKMFYVADVREYENDYLLLVEDENGQKYRTWYKKESNIDLRSPEPQYFVYDGRPAFLTRSPARQQQQGVTANVAAGKWAGGAQTFRVHNVHQLMQTLGSDHIVWDNRLWELMVKAKAMSSLRLSKDVAVFLQKKDVFCEYRGRLLGEVKEDKIIVDECDYQRPWINRDIHNIGCSLKVE